MWQQMIGQNGFLQGSPNLAAAERIAIAAKNIFHIQKQNIFSSLTSG